MTPRTLTAWLLLLVAAALLTISAFGPDYYRPLVGLVGSAIMVIGVVVLAYQSVEER
jgi:membrane-bound ClpP family serine protease